MRAVRSRAAWAAGWAAVLALVAAPLAMPRERRDEPSSLAARLFGPIGALAASVQWVRFEAALDAGLPELAYSRAALALRLDPHATGGWTYLAAHLALERGSAEVEPDPERRAGWFRAALALLERGERSARDPAALALQRGLYLAAIADSEGALPWPGGETAARREAAAAFGHAAELGSKVAAELALRVQRASTPEDGAPR